MENKKQMRKKYEGRLKGTLRSKLLTLCAGTRIDNKTFCCVKETESIMCCDRMT